MNNKWKSLKSELTSLGIDPYNMTEGTENGYPVIFLYKDGDKDSFSGYSDDDYACGYAMDENESLKRRFGK